MNLGILFDICLSLRRVTEITITDDLSVSTEQAATKILARQLIRLRQQITKLQESRAQMRGVATHTQVRWALSINQIGS